MSSSDLGARMAKPKIGLLATGHLIYWDQFPGLKDMCMKMYHELISHLKRMGDVVSPGLVDTQAKAESAGRYFKQEEIDIILVCPLGYTTGMVLLPCVRQLDIPIRILNTHIDSSYDYKMADTAEYLYHEGPCCIPEYAAGLITIGKAFIVRTGPFSSQRFWDEVQADCNGAAAARAFRAMNVAIIGNTYTGMVDMPTDEHRWLKATGKMIIRPEVEEIEEAYHRVKPAQLEAMYEHFRQLYEVDESVTNEHMKVSAQLAVAYEEIIIKHDIYAFGYYWWGEKQLITQMRAQSGLAVSRLASLGRPGVTEGDLRTAMGMKMLDLLGGGGMFVEFFAIDYDEDFLLLGHDGPSNINMSEGKPRLQNLDVHHGKTGHGLGIDFEVIRGTATLLNISQFGCDGTFKMICTTGEIVDGEVLNIGNPNCRVKINQSIHTFFDKWCQQGPSHHIAMGLGDLSDALETFAVAMNFEFIKI